MSSKLLAYTTVVPVERTVQEIMSCLRSHRAKSIVEDLDGSGKTIGVRFAVTTSQGDLAFRLPVNADAVYRVLVRQHTKGRYPTQDQAARVAWRIILNWIKVQMSLIETEQASLQQIMLPYTETPSGESLYEVLLQGGQLKALSAPGDK